MPFRVSSILPHNDAVQLRASEAKRVSCNRGLYGRAERAERETEAVEDSLRAWAGPTGELSAGDPGRCRDVAREDDRGRLNKSRKSRTGEWPGAWALRGRAKRRGETARVSRDERRKRQAETTARAAWLVERSDEARGQSVR